MLALFSAVFFSGCASGETFGQWLQKHSSNEVIPDSPAPDPSPPPPLPPPPNYDPITGQQI